LLVVSLLNVIFMPQVAHLFFFFSPPAAASEGLPTGETLAETPRDPGCVRDDAWT
jgi:hypothetical protein